jgi:hypothetical protein
MRRTSGALDERGNRQNLLVCRFGLAGWLKERCRLARDRDPGCGSAGCGPGECLLEDEAGAGVHYRRAPCVDG